MPNSNLNFWCCVFKLICFSFCFKSVLQWVSWFECKSHCLMGVMATHINLMGSPLCCVNTIQMVQVTLISYLQERRMQCDVGNSHWIFFFFYHRRERHVHEHKVGDTRLVFHWGHNELRCKSKSFFDCMFLPDKGWNTKDVVLYSGKKLRGMGQGQGDPWYVSIKSQLKVFWTKASTCMYRDRTLKNHKNEMGMTPQYFHIIPVHLTLHWYNYAHYKLATCRLAYSHPLNGQQSCSTVHFTAFTNTYST